MVRNINKNLAERFSEVFHKKLWVDSESVSGPGSNRSSSCVRESIEALQYVVNNYTIQTLSDIPCGDMNWMPEFLQQNKAIDYRGYDIVEALIRDIAQKWPNYKFEVLDITQAPPPKTDLIFCKELLLHLEYRDICFALNNMKNSGSTYLLLFNNFGAANILMLPDNQPGTARPIDVCAAPFNYPQPLWRNQTCGLWKLSDVPYLDGDLSGLSLQGETSVEKELRAALYERIEVVNRLYDALGQREKDVKTLETALQQREKDVRALETALQQREKDVKTLEAALEQYKNA